MFPKSRGEVPSNRSDYPLILTEYRTGYVGECILHEFDALLLLALYQVVFLFLGLFRFDGLDPLPLVARKLIPSLTLLIRSGLLGSATLPRLLLAQAFFGILFLLSLTGQLDLVLELR